MSTIPSIDIYVVRATAGEYSDRREWNVIAYTNKGDAEHHAERAAERAKEVAVLIEHHNDHLHDSEEFEHYISGYDLPEEFKDLDPNLSMSWSEPPEYYVTEVELRSS